MKKIETAQILLLTNSLNINQIYDKTGFNNLPYFYQIFQKQAACTKAIYRRMGGLV